MALLFNWTRTRSWTIWSSCLLHGVINGSAGATVLFMWAGHPLVGSVAAVAGVNAIVLLSGAAVRWALSPYDLPRHFRKR
jgi:hypothetical protein